MLDTVKGKDCNAKGGTRTRRGGVQMDLNRDV